MTTSTKLRFFLKGGDDQPAEQVWHISDTHFGHITMMKFCPQSRQYADTEEMDEDIIRRWNAVVQPEDTVIHYGDVSFHGGPKTIGTVERLNGKIVVLVGNHDNPQALKRCKNVVAVHENVRLNFLAAGRTANQAPRMLFSINAFHYPIWDWDGLYSNRLHVHGHTHGLSPMPLPNCIDVGFDAIRDENGEFFLRPVTTAEVCQAIHRRNQRLIEEGCPTTLDRFRRMKKTDKTLSDWLEGRSI